ncbi:hypothetical protein [Polymorphospora rubra]|uniref:hypothetical protein n=1 Tax=Polymorphospora rubra TaxID=338584 RepID=UPI0033E6B1D1
MNRERWILILAGCAIVSLASLIPAAAAVSMAAYRTPEGQEQPKFTDWMQAWGGVGGVVAGLVAALAAGLLLRYELKRGAEAERQAAEERAEAALNIPRAVVVTPARFTTYSSNTISNVAVTVHNFGPQPIRNVAVIVTLPEDGERLIFRPSLMIRAGSEERLTEKYSSASVRAGGRAHVTVCFIDYTGQAWQQTSDGEVSRTTMPYPAVAEALGSSDTSPSS